MFGLDNQQFIALFGVIFYILGYVVAWLYHIVILHRLPGNQQERLKEIVADATKAATYVNSHNTVQDAIQKVEDLCKTFKINFDLTTVTHLVHAALYELKTVVPATAPVANTIDNAASWLLDASQQPTASSKTAPTSVIPSTVTPPAFQGLPIIPPSMPGQSQQ